MALALDRDPALGMASGMHRTQFIDLPLELWGSTCQWLGADDIRNTRLACSLFNDAASPFLLKRAWLSSSSEDQKTLTAISLHPIFSKYVKEVYYDGTIYDPDLLNAFNNDRYYRKCVRKFLKNKSNFVWPKNALRYAISQYKARCKEQIELQAYQGAHLTRLSDDPLPNLGSLIEAATRSNQVPDSLNIDKFDVYLPADLLCLLRALQRMPGVREVGISDRRWSVSRYSWDDCREYAIFRGPNDKPNIIQSSKIRGRQTLQIHPRHCPFEYANWEHSRIWHRGFHVLTQAASMLKLKQLRSFTVDGSDSGVSYIVLDMTSTELMHTCNAFQHLTSINLELILPDDISQSDWIKVLDSGNIASVLNAAQGLTRLDLGFDVAYVACTKIPELAKLLGPLTWPSLQHLCMRNMALEEEDFVPFLTRHIGTLKSISLDHMVLINHLPKNAEFAYPTPRSWNGAFRSMSVLALTYLSVSTPLNGGLYQLAFNWHSKEPAKINRFLVSGGDTWFAAKELGYDQEWQRQWLEAQQGNDWMD